MRFAMIGFPIERLDIPIRSSVQGNAMKQLSAICILCVGFAWPAGAQPPRYRISAFREAITIPVGHRCVGILPVKAKQIEAPLEAIGFVLIETAIASAYNHHSPDSQPEPADETP